MNGVLTWLLGSARFVPHGFCLLWRPDLVAIHVVSDALIAVAYFAIPWAIYSFVRQRSDLQSSHKGMALLFVAFIMLCGLTHVASIVTLWQPYYGLQALTKAVTAVVSIATASALPFVIPKLLQIPSPETLSVANGRLQAEVNAHQVTLRQLTVARGDLERQVAEQTEALRVANARFAAALANSQVTLSEQDAQRRYTWVYNPTRGLRGEDYLGKTEEELMPPAPAAELRALREDAVASGELRRGELSVPGDAGEAWFDIKVEPTRLSSGEPGVLTVATDITAQKTQQRHLELVMRELNHRAKNLLSIVQSIARQTARGETAKGADVPEAFLKTLNERLRALAATHDILVQQNWEGADLRKVADGQLAEAAAHNPGRVTVAGKPVALPADAAHYVGLALHELVANAAAYGALSTERGRVHLSWTAAAGPEGGRRLDLVWRELDGPTVIAPERQGFGRSILETLTARALGGTAALSFAPEGVVWTLTAPIRPGGDSLRRA